MSTCRIGKKWIRSVVYTNVNFLILILYCGSKIVTIGENWLMGTWDLSELFVSIDNQYLVFYFHKHSFGVSESVYLKLVSFKVSLFRSGTKEASIPVVTPESNLETCPWIWWVELSAFTCLCTLVQEVAYLTHCCTKRPDSEHF